MNKKIGFIIDPLGSLKPEKDTSLYLMQAAIERGYQVFIATLPDLFIQDGTAFAKLTEIKNAETKMIGETNTRPLNELAMVFMRKDPPFDMRYIYATYILELAEKTGTRVLNKPQSIRDCNEKIFITQFPNCITDTLVASDVETLSNFLKTHKDIVLKTLDSMGGNGVYRLQLNDFDSTASLETHINGLINTNGALMAQRFLPAVYEGDKRIILFDGEPLPYAVVRLPKENEFRANLAQGGHYNIAPLTERDAWLCEQIKPELQSRGLFFVGLDVIGDYITEINVTSPTCLRELDKDSPVDPANVFWEALLN